MEAFFVTGGAPLRGRVQISGAKNAALPILFACLLTEGVCRIRNVPALRDVASALQLLQQLGAECGARGGAARVRVPSALATLEAPYDIVRTMRASVLCLGPLVARFGRAVVSLPGGCAIGARPLDAHIAGLQEMGASISVQNGYLVAECRKLHGADITLPAPSVTGTENLMMAATLAEGETILRRAAREPEVVDLANFLIAAGADIQGAGSECIRISGARKLTAANYAVMPDRIEAGTYLAAVAAAGGSAELAGARAADMERVLAVFAAGGARIKPSQDGIAVQCERGQFLGADAVTAPHPGFPTDMQAQLLAANCVASGGGAVSETVFENRFMHVPELQRMGADIALSERTAFVTGKPALTAATVMATDLRASASLVIAALAAQGTSRIRRIYHLDRGYERMEKKLRALGAKVSRRKE